MGEKDLPEGWVWTTLGEIVETVNPGFPTGQHNSEGKGVPHLRPMNITINGEIDLNVIRYVESRDHMPLKKGDILFNNTNSPDLVGKTALIEKDTNWAFSNHMTRIKLPVDLTIPKYFSRYLHLLFLEGVFKENSNKHVNQASISREFLINLIKVPLPPLSDQQHIAQKLDRLMGYLKDASTALEEVPVLLEAFRQKVLAMAVKGELTKEWRERNPKTTPTSLQKNREEEFNLELVRLKFEGRRTPKLSPFKRLPSTLFPMKWETVSVESAALFIIDCLHSTPKFVRQGNYCIDTNCIENFRIVWDEARFVDDITFNERISRLKPKKGDILFSREGTIGTTVHYKGEHPICLGQRMMMFRFASFLKPDFAEIILISDHFIRQYKPFIVGTTAQHLNIGDIRDLAIPIPSIEEQNEIISKVKHLLLISENIETDYEITKDELASLPQAILAKAFAGELILPIPEAEGAMRLLERIRLEKTKLEGSRKLKRKTSFKNGLKKRGMDSNQTIKEVLQKTPGVKVLVKDVLQQSKYNMTKDSPLDMDGFYEELKTLTPSPVREIRESKEVYLILESNED